MSCMLFRNMFRLECLRVNTDQNNDQIYLRSINEKCRERVRERKKQNDSKISFCFQQITLNAIMT